MKETQEIIKAYESAISNNKRMALATVVEVEGSSYRRPGARMLVTEDGKLTGAISGGCLEGDALRRALLSILEGKNKLITYDITEEEDAKIGIQLGCNGIVHILFEPVDPEEPANPVALLRRSLSNRAGTVLVTLFDKANHAAEHLGTCLFASEKNQSVNKCEELADIRGLLWKEAIFTLQQRTTVIRPVGKYTALFNFIPPPVSLIIVGAGNDAIPVMNLAASLGWHITVADGRDGHATANRFPEAEKVLVSSADDLLKHLTIDDRTAVVLMTHNYNYDLSVLRALLPTDCRYIGVLGPKAKMERMLAELEQEGIAVGAAQKARLFGPVGLDLGAEAPVEIALSIVAEVQAVFSGRNGSVLREKKQPIHRNNLDSHE